MNIRTTVTDPSHVTGDLDFDFLGKSTKEKPSIIVSGADDGRVYLLRPQSWSQYIWHYSTDVILHREGSSIGVPAVGDVDGDGNVEVFVPEKNFIHVLTYAGKFPDILNSRIISSFHFFSI